MARVSVINVESAGDVKTKNVNNVVRFLFEPIADQLSMEEKVDVFLACNLIAYSSCSDVM